MSVELTSDPIDTRELAEALYKAAVAAGHAPSIYNTQPWRWKIQDTVLDLYAERTRMLEISDPEGLLATVSCGAALHHARVALAAHGWRATVKRLPDSHDPDHLARLTIAGPAPIGRATESRARTIRLRRTERHPVVGEPVGRADLDLFTEAAEAEGSLLHILRPEQVFALAAATSHAQGVEAADPRWRAELARWTGSGRGSGTGVPDAGIPETDPETPVPGRDFGRHGILPTTNGHDRPAVFAVLYGLGDAPPDWLRAGESLSALWLVATEMGVSVLPLSAPIEVAGARETIRGLLADLGHPYLALRLGHRAADDDAAERSPRLPADQIIERTHA